MAEDDIEKAATELLVPSDSLDRFRALVLGAGILDFAFATLFSEADIKLMEALQKTVPAAQKGYRRLTDFSAARDEWHQIRQNQLSPSNIRDQQKSLLPE